MITLALESANKVTGVAIAENGELIFEQLLNVGLTQSETLMPMLEEAAVKCGVTMDLVNKIAVDIGPGSFTGIRIGVCSANALAFALKKGIVGISSLDILAAGSPYIGNVHCLIDARNSQVYGCSFDNSDMFPVKAGDYFAGDVQAFLQSLPVERALFVGDGATAHSKLIQERFGDLARFAPAHHNVCRAGALAVLASGRDGVDQVLPFYLKPSSAQMLKLNVE